MLFHLLSVERAGENSELSLEAIHAGNKIKSLFSSSVQNIASITKIYTLYYVYRDEMYI